jgi:prepilin-type N-terminal cleavage/methylation domain-containing protein
LDPAGERGVGDRGGEHSPAALRPRGLGAPGFSLIEMLMVVTMIAIILAIGVPALNQQMVRGRLVGASEQVATHLHLARVEAMRKGFPVVVRPDFTRQHLVAFLDEDADLAFDAGEDQVYDLAVPGDLSRTGVNFMGPDLIVAVDGAPAQSVDGLTPVAGGARVAVFEPGGSIRDVGAIRLGDGKTPEANVFEVRVEPEATARIELRKWIYGDGGDPDAFLPSGGGAWTWY